MKKKTSEIRDIDGLLK